MIGVGPGDGSNGQAGCDPCDFGYAPGGPTVGHRRPASARGGTTQEPPCPSNSSACRPISCEQSPMRGTHPDARPGRSHPARPPGSRSARGRADRDRQDRRVRAADPRAPAGPRQHQLLAGPTPGAGTDPDPDARAGDAGRATASGRTGAYVPLRSASSTAACRSTRRPRSCSRGLEILVATPGPAARPPRPADGQARPGRGPRARRGRPDARHGLPARHPPDRRAAARPPPEPAVLGDVPRGDPEALSGTLLTRPGTVEVAPRNTPIELVRQLIYPVDRDRKRALLAHLIRNYDWHQVLVFTRTKIAASRLAGELLTATASTPWRSTRDRTQGERTRALAAFKAGEIRVLVATDVAARGLDIEELPFVVNYELPKVPGGLHPPDRAHRPRRHHRRGDLAGLHRRGGPAPGDPADAQASDPLEGRGRLHPRSQRRAATRRHAHGSRPDRIRTPCASQAGSPTGRRRERSQPLRVGGPSPGYCVRRARRPPRRHPARLSWS